MNRMLERAVEAFERVATALEEHLTEARARNEMLSIIVEQGRKYAAANDASIAAVQRAETCSLFTWTPVDVDDPSNPNVALSPETELAYVNDAQDMREHVESFARRRAVATGKTVEVFRHDFATILYIARPVAI